MNTLKTRLTSLSLVAATVAALGLSAMNATSASAAPSDGPWPEQPSCSIETFTCTSIADQLAYECYFVETDGMDWCDTDLEDMLEITFTPSRGPNDLTIGKPTPPPPPPVKSFKVR